MCVLLSSRIATFDKKCPNVTPKGSQKEAKNHQNGGCPTTQQICFLQYGSPFWPFRLGSGSTCFLQCFSDTVYFSAFWRLLRFWVPKGYPNGGRVSWENVSKFDPVPQKLPRDPRKGPPMDFKRPMGLHQEDPKGRRRDP